MKRLLVDFAGMGDLIILTPLLRKLAAAGEVDLLTRPYGPGVFDDQPFIHRVFPLAHPNRGRSLCGKLLLGGHRRALARVLVAQHYDEIVCFEQERELIMRQTAEGQSPDGQSPDGDSAEADSASL